MATGSRNWTCSKAVRPSRMRIGTLPFSARSNAASSSFQQMIARLGAASVHLLTATGAVLGLLALLAVEARDWQMMFVWLGIALVVDAVADLSPASSASRSCCRDSAASASI